MIKSESALILQLWRTISAMDHIDELFRWLLQTIVQQFGVEIGQLWTYQTEDNHHSLLALRELVHRDLSPPWNVLTGEPTLAIVEHIMCKQKNIPLQTVQAVYSLHRATLLQRYGVNYCAGYGVQDDLFLPAKAAPQMISSGMVPQKLVLLIFSRQGPQDSLKEIQPLLQQALLMAERCHLLRIRPSTSTRFCARSTLAFECSYSPPYDGYGLESSRFVIDDQR